MTTQYYPPVPVSSRLRILVTVAKWAAFAAFGLLALAIVMTVGGVRSPFLPTEITHQEPYSALSAASIA